MIDYRAKRGGKNCVIWTRVSTKYQEENGGSLDYQKTLCERYAAEHGLHICDVGSNHGYFGGKHESAKTPGKMVKEMTNVVKKNQAIRYVLVSEFDRFSRSNGQAITILEDLRTLGVIVVAVKIGITTETKEGFLMARNTLNIAEWDNDNRTDKFYSGRQHCMQLGAWIEKAPIGYYKVGKSIHTECYLNEQGKLIQQAFKWKLQEVSNKEILDRLANRGMVITKQTLDHIFKNVFYAGKIKSKFVEGLVDGKIEKAVSYEDWLKVQKILSKRSGKYKHQKQKPNCPLTRHVACADCGTPFTSYSVKSKGKDYYKCNKIGCKNNVNADEMHAKYKELLVGYDIPYALLCEYEDTIKLAFKHIITESENQTTILRKRLTEVEKDIKTCQMRFATDKLDSSTFNVVMDELNKQKKLIETELEAYDFKLSNLTDKIKEVIITCSNISSLWDKGDLEIKQRIQNLVFPEGILWERSIRNYRTPTRNKVFDVIDRLSIEYKKKTEENSVESSSEVKMCAG